MRIVGNKKALNSYEERLDELVRVSGFMKSLGIPSFRRTGVFRGSQKMFDQMDMEALIKRQRWLNEHST